METVNIDADLENADWTKTSWDFPPYKSKEFMEQIDDLDSFRKLPVYKAAVEKGLIHDDEWVGDHCKPATAKKKKAAKDSGRHIHIHLPRKGKA